MQQSKTNIGFALIAALIIYVIAITYQGYYYGQGDQSQILPVLLEQDRPGTYSRDHYVHAYLQSGVNERTIFHFLLRHAGYQYPMAVFFWHALFSIALIVAWIQIAAQFIRSRLFQFIAVIAILTLGFHFTTGSNEMYYPSLVPSLCAKALASWALFSWIKGKYWTWVVMLFVAALLQPLVGLQVFIITSAGLALYAWQKQKLADFPWIPAGLFIISVIPWFFLLAYNNGGHSDPSRFISILEFRLSHHFIGSYFHPLQLVATIVFMAVAIMYFEERLKWMFITTAFGILLYEIGAELLNIATVYYSQWWKTTIWIEAFAFIAIAAFLEQKLKFVSRFSINPLLIILTILGLTFVYRFSGIRNEKPAYMLPFTETATAEVDISRMANKLTPPDALFLVAPELTDFRWYSQRSSFVDYKAMLHTEEFLFDWYDRIDLAYEYNDSVKQSGTSIYQQAKTLFNMPDAQLMDKWRALGITHLITYGDSIPHIPVLARNGSYALYRIK